MTCMGSIIMYTISLKLLKELPHSVLQTTKLGERLGNEDFVQLTFLIIS